MSSDREAIQLGEVLYSLWSALRDYSRHNRQHAIFHHWVSGVVFVKERSDEETILFDVKGKRYTFRCAGFWDRSGTYEAPRLPDGSVARIRLTLSEGTAQPVFAMTRPGEVELVNPGEWGSDLLALADSRNAIEGDRAVAMMLKLCRLGYWPHGRPTVEDDNPGPE